MSSGSAEQHEEHRYGTSKPQLWWVLTSRSWVETSINYFLIEHRDGLFLFDTGLDPRIATDKRYISSALVLLPTPGHTPGSLSMLIRCEGWAPILLIGDLTYEAALLDDDVIPGTGDPIELRATYAKVRRLKERLPGLAIVPSHDPNAAKEIARAMSTGV